jgi:hypothetical protein
MSKKSRRTITPDFNFIPDDLVSYKSQDCLLYLCSADEILNRFKYDSILMFNNIRKGNYDLTKVYIKEDNCLCNIGLGKRPRVNTHKCNACSMLRSLCPKNKLPEDRRIEIQVGKYEGKKIEVMEFDDIFLPYERNTENENKFIQILSKENLFSLLDDSLIKLYKNVKFYNTKSYITNYALTCIFLNNKMSKYKLPNLIPFDWVYSCNNKVRIVKPVYYKYTHINDIELLNRNLKSPTAQTKISPLNEKAVVAIVKQLTVILHFYNKYSFIHGRPSIEYINFNNNHCSYKYGDIIIDSPLTLSIEPSLYTSIGFENDFGEIIRLNSNKTTHYISSLSYPVEKIDINVSPIPRSVPDNNSIPLIQDLRNHFVYCYKIGNNISNFLVLQTYYGIPLVQGSFDFYCFIICLLFEDSFYTTFMENENLKNIWYGMWKSSEYNKMSSELLILKTKDDLNYEDIVKFLSQYYLRIDIIKYFYDCMTQI